MRESTTLIPPLTVVQSPSLRQRAGDSLGAPVARPQSRPFQNLIERPLLVATVLIQALSSRP
jgi:hypothetical protein